MSRKLVQRDAAREVTAAAVRYTKTTAKALTKASNRADQARAWDFYRTPEVRSFANWISNAMAGVRLYAGRRGEGGAIEAAPPDHPAARIVAEIAGGPDGQAQLLREYGRHLAVAGEGYTVVQPREDGSAAWHVLSVSEISTKGAALEAEIDGQKIVIPPADDEQTAPDDAPVAIRVWDPHPQQHTAADSPVIAALDVLEELRLLGAAVRAVTLSRLTGRGVLVVPTGTKFPGTPTQGGAEDDLIDIFMEVAETAIRDPSSAAATVPIVLEVPAEMVGSIQRLTFESDFDELAIKLREECIRRFATAADIPAEFLLGLGDTNHWSAWALTSEAIQLGIEPRAGVLALAYTEHWLRPLLAAEGVEDATEWLVAVDTSPLRVRANRSQTALEVFDRGAISARALRRETGFDEADAPDADELAARNKNNTDDPDDPQPGTEPLPVDESNAAPNTLPAASTPPHAMRPDVLAAADGLIWAALAQAGEKLRRTPACPRSERAAAREIHPARLHTLLRVDTDDVDRWGLLDGAWTRVDEVAARYTLDVDCLAAALSDYCRELIAAGIAHSYDLTPGALRTPCMDTAA
ncbi:hypothetical protein OIE91_11225 [Streptomyces albidoflavus]|uniref:hypothetical protein n=1 Tax=Streptomyces albidoflavus TaxID=1886 RepID=UPI00352ED3DB